jgi:uncharacterized protein (TIGR03067 family)
VNAEIERFQGTWDIVDLELDGATMAESGFRGSQIVVKGSTFTTISMGAMYGGTLAVDAATSPKTLDLTFKSGPEKGNKSLAIYKLDGDTWELCLAVTGKTRPTSFATKAGSGHALETLKRQTGSSARETILKELALLQGEWSLVEGSRDGQALPADFVKTGRRLVKGNETTVLFGSQVFLKAAFSLDPSKTPKTIDYIVTAGESLGEAQAGIYAFQGDTVTYCLAPSGRPRPTDFAIKAGVGATLTAWKRKKKK